MVPTQGSLGRGIPCGAKPTMSGLMGKKKGEEKANKNSSWEPISTLILRLSCVDFFLSFLQKTCYVGHDCPDVAALPVDLHAWSCSKICVYHRPPHLPTRQHQLSHVCVGRDLPD